MCNLVTNFELTKKVDSLRFVGLRIYFFIIIIIITKILLIFKVQTQGTNFAILRVQWKTYSN